MWPPAAPQCSCCSAAVPPDPPSSEPVTTENTCMKVGKALLPHCHLSRSYFQLRSALAKLGLRESPDYWEHMWSWRRYHSEETAFRDASGSRVIRASLSFLAVLGLLHSTASMSFMSSCYWLCMFWHSSSSGLLSKPRGAKVETSSTCVNRCLVSPTWWLICCLSHKLIQERSKEVCGVVLTICPPAQSANETFLTGVSAPS